MAQRPRSFVRRLGGAALAATLALAASVSAAEPRSAAERPNASRLLFLVEYIGSDYDRAIRNGVVVDQVEYGEMLRFTRDAVAEYAKGGPRDDEISRALATLASDVEKREGARTIQKAARSLINLLTARLEGVPSPASAPDLSAGGALFAAECSRCHGSLGAGDGPLAADLDPKPASFRGERMDALTPRHVYNTLTLGIDGTGMPSFAASLSEAQRWNAAFFVMTLRDGFAPAPPATPVSIVLEDLVASRNPDLLAMLRRSDPAASAATVDFVRANAATIPLERPATDAARPAGLDSLATAMQLQDAFATAAGRVSPSVVGIASFARIDGPNASPPAAGGWQSSGAAGVPEGMRPLHSGSGFVIGDGRDIATCDHLLRGDDGSIAETVRVDLPDGTELEARVVGTEPALDLAIVRVGGANWKKPEPALSFADSSAVRTGNWLIALGDPPGARTTFAVGVASAPAQRECYQEDRSATMLQSSISIAPDALGGPVADIEGNVVGMGVRLPAIPASPSGPAQPSQNAILPANLLLNLHAALEAAGSTESPWLGVSVLELELLRSQLGDRAASASIPEKGVFIDNVFDPSPATRAGVKRGDYLVGVGDADIDSVADFQRALYATGIGRNATLRLVRAGKPLALTATVEQRPGEAVMR